MWRVRKQASSFPIPMAMAIPLKLGPYFAIDVCWQLDIVCVEEGKQRQGRCLGANSDFGLICGDGTWTLSSSLLDLAGVKPPICMKFLSRATNVKVDNFLTS
ncbi:hypothetical protein SLA2020_186390 [Shorea laevis]